MPLVSLTVTPKLAESAGLIEVQGVLGHRAGLQHLLREDVAGDVTGQDALRAFRVRSAGMPGVLFTAQRSRARPTNRRTDHPPTSRESTAGRTGRSSPGSNRSQPCPR